MTAEEAALARFLEASVLPGFVRTRGREQRIDSYLELNNVLRLEDTEGSVRLFQRHLPALLAEIHRDMEHTTVQDVLHIALRTLSYFMYHKSLAACFTSAQTSQFLTDLIRLLASTQDEATYKLCLWSLTMQNVDTTRYEFLHRIVEALVQAIVNPFKSRAIELQALKGLHLLVLKCPEAMWTTPGVLALWFRPVTSRLSSSDRTTRDHVSKLLQDVASHLPDASGPGGPEQGELVATALRDYALPALQTHMAYERNLDALMLWRLVLQLMRRSLAKDLSTLNELLYVPEMSMRHANPSVRLLSMEAWEHLVSVFEQSDEWIFKKPVVQLLVRPILVCLEEETMVNVLHASLTTWLVIANAVIKAFNAFCHTHERSADAIQQSVAKKWKRWVEEVLKKVVIAALEQEAKHRDVPGKTVIYARFVQAVQDVLGRQRTRRTAPEATHSGIGSSSTLIDGSLQNASTPGRGALTMDLSERDEGLLDDELRERQSSSASNGAVSDGPSPLRLPVLCDALIGLAFILPDVLGSIQRLARMAAATSDSNYKDRLTLVAFSIWDGYCQRLEIAGKREDTKDVTSSSKKLRHRLVRLCLDFAFGVSTAAASASGSSIDSQVSVMQSISLESLTTETPLTPSVVTGGSTPLFGLLWQLQLVHAALSVPKNTDELNGMLVHPKSKLVDHIRNRLDTLTDRIEPCRDVVKYWESGAATSDASRIDLGSKTHSVPCVLLYLLCGVALVLDGELRSNQTARESTVKLFADAATMILAGLPTTEPVNDKFARFIEKSGRLAKGYVADEAQQPSTSEQYPCWLLQLCLERATHSSESEENATMLLQLQQTVPNDNGEPEVNKGDEDVDERTDGSIISISSDPSSASPCLLDDRKAAAAMVTETSITGDNREPDSPERSVVRRREMAPETPTRAKTPTKAPSSALTPAKSSLRNPAAPVMTPSGSNADDKQPFYPDLVDCPDPISQVYRHFPISFRAFFPFYEIKTVGDLSALPASQIQTFGIKDPIATVTKALEEFKTRKNRLKTLSSSPFRSAVQSPLARSPVALTASSSKRIPKRGMPSPSRLLAPLPLESPQRKRARRSIRELSSELDAADESAEIKRDDDGQDNKLWPGVTFCLDIGGGETKITRPGEDSQEPRSPSLLSRTKEEDDEDRDEKLQTYTAKMLQHLNRSVYYMDKLVNEDESVHSDTSLTTDAAKMNMLLADINRAHQLVTRLSGQLQVATERSGKKCARVLEKNGT
ncbi:hypothetical protein Poli38472_002209 [Pythium oligandrum]|uniref:Telomere-associated protein Rif1 N-terminal domain-containing protein n=1 Tax=Pythium oligandrum TaxID=41045 RepID=A0A8K1FM28_PYTOL|nr:hypothetical protein Poli38472_002209 [Pythium oligandrum]|eukprot:TMW63268.1 hypothetical protein Poli38472_002209 [Pythium oligandrum]